MQRHVAGVPGRIRTSDLWSRSPTLYPAELQVQHAYISTFYFPWQGCAQCNFHKDMVILIRRCGHEKSAILDGFFEILSFLMLILTIVFFARSYEALPVRLPRGDAEALLGARISICLLFSVGFVVYGLLFALKRFPRLMSYPVRITPENMDYQARIGKLMLSILTFCCMSMILRYFMIFIKELCSRQQGISGCLPACWASRWRTSRFILLLQN